MPFIRQATIPERESKMKFLNYFKQLSTKRCDFWEKTEMKKVVAVATIAAFFIFGMPAEAEATLKAGSALEKPAQSAPQEEPPLSGWSEAGKPEELEYDPEAFVPAGESRTLRLDLQTVPEKSRTPELCLEAVRESALNFRHVPDASATEEICLEAVRQDGDQLRLVPERFKTQTVCAEAVRQEPGSFKFVPEKLRTKDMCEDVVRRLPGMLAFVPEKLKTPEMCAESLARINPAYKDYMLQYVPVRMQAEVLRRADILATRRDGDAQTPPAEQDQVRHGAGVLLPNR